jgi:GTP-binding protein
VKIHSAEFIRSAAGVADFPRDPAPQIAFVGRSNVGKSSLINALVRQRIARTSAAAGKTRHVNLYRVSLDAPGLERLYLVDLPGYGYARGGADSAQAFEALTTAYFRCPSVHATGEHGVPLGPTLVIHVVDARHPGLDADRRAADWLMRQERPVAAVAAKIDKLTRAERAHSLKAWQDTLHVPILPVSAVTGEGLKELWQTISGLLKSSRQKSEQPSA